MPAESDKNSSTPRAPGAIDPEATTKSIAEDMVAIRENLTASGSKFAVGAGVILAGLGYTQVHELFPLPEAHKWLIGIIGVAGGVLALLTAAAFTGRIFGARRRILIDSRLARPKRGLNKWERKEQRRIYCDEHARDELAADLVDVEDRASRLRRISRALDGREVAAGAAGEAERLDGVVSIAQAETALVILERRARDAFSGWRTKGLVLGFILGIVMVFGAADYAKGERELIELLASCQKAVDEGAFDACDPIRPKVDRTDELAAARGSLTRTARRKIERYEDCARVVVAEPAFIRLEPAAKKEWIVECAATDVDERPGLRPLPTGGSASD
jgi:hypothetical protein